MITEKKSVNPSTQA